LHEIRALLVALAASEEAEVAVPHERR
jgi:hypothetical protein